MSDRRLLIAYAHPDDESFGLGGLIAKYVAEGVDVYLICATNGDVGTVAPEMLNGYASVSELRLAELDCAAAILRLKAVFKLGYRDSGMMGSDTSAHPDCLWQAPVDEVTARVVDVIRQVRPQVVITFNRYGGYGHPDHIAIQRATTRAFDLAGSPDYGGSSLSPYAPQKLYYSNIHAFMVRLGIMRVRMQGKDPRRLGRNSDLDLQAVLDNVEPIHTVVNVRDYFDIWDEANRCHASQLGGGMPRIPMAVRRRFFASQTFTRIVPAPRRNRIDERDLFAGVRVDEPVANPVS